MMKNFTSYMKTPTLVAVMFQSNIYHSPPNYKPMTFLPFPLIIECLVKTSRRASQVAKEKQNV